MFKDLNFISDVITLVQYCSYQSYLLIILSQKYLPLTFHLFVIPSESNLIHPPSAKSTYPSSTASRLQGSISIPFLYLENCSIIVMYRNKIPQKYIKFTNYFFLLHVS